MTDRELDALVATTFGDRRCEETCTFPDKPRKWYPDDNYAVFGGPSSWGPGHVHHFGGGLSAGAPTRYSHDIESAWAVVKEMRLRGWDYEIGSDTGAAHMCDFTSPDYVGGDPAPMLRGFATDDILPRAICLAALRALGVTP